MVYDSISGGTYYGFDLIDFLVSRNLWIMRCSFRYFLRVLLCLNQLFSCRLNIVVDVSEINLKTIEINRFCEEHTFVVIGLLFVWWGFMAWVCLQLHNNKFQNVGKVKLEINGVFIEPRTLIFCYEKEESPKRVNLELTTYSIRYFFGITFISYLRIKIKRNRNFSKNIFLFIYANFH